MQEYSLYLDDILIIPSYISDMTQFRDDRKKPVQSAKNPLLNTTKLSVPMKADLWGLRNFSGMIYLILALIHNTFPGEGPSGIENNSYANQHQQPKKIYMALKNMLHPLRALMLYCQLFEV